MGPRLLSSIRRSRRSEIPERTQDQSGSPQPRFRLLHARRISDAPDVAGIDDARPGRFGTRPDLLLFHRRLRCLVIIDLKIGALVHGDIGQMNLYCNYARAHWMQPDEHPPVGLILCTHKDEALARYALDGLHNK